MMWKPADNHCPIQQYWDSDWKVFVYYNLRAHCFSVKALQGPAKGKVIAHMALAGVVGAQFRVSEAGRLRVLATGRKNVHAGVVGLLRPFWDMKTQATDTVFEGRQYWEKVRYNPRELTTFVGEDGRPVTEAKACALYSNGAFIPREEAV